MVLPPNQNVTYGGVENDLKSVTQFIILLIVVRPYSEEIRDHIKKLMAKTTEDDDAGGSSRAKVNIQ